MTLNEIAGKACLVTGASRGIGAAVAQGLGAHGAKVMVHYRSGQAQAEAVAAYIETTAAPRAPSRLISPSRAPRTG
jgi:3-oxoacyl-[acyl-carrier protein] reductase